MILGWKEIIEILEIRTSHSGCLTRWRVAGGMSQGLMGFFKVVSDSEKLENSPRDASLCIFIIQLHYLWRPATGRCAKSCSYSRELRGGLSY